MIGKPLEVEVRDNLEKAMKILKQKMSKEGILQEVKRRRFYEKPSVKRKRKMREARKRRRREMKRRGARLASPIPKATARPAPRVVRAHGH
jgi:small subunit ribosomal protein S21